MKIQAVLQARQLMIGYHPRRKDERVVLRDLNFELRSGELTCLLGPNGVGKSTLLRTLASNQPPLGGELTLDKRPLSGFSRSELAGKLGLVLTDATQAGGLRVHELVALGRQPHTGFFGRLTARDRQAVTDAMRLVGILHKRDAYVAELSDGERQKVMIAKVLVQECPVIILDEPTAFLDAVSRMDVMTLLRRLAAVQGKAVLLSTHDVDEALQLADRLWLLTPQGIQTGATEDLVISGAMDGLMPHPGIRFDAASGRFQASVAGGRRVCIEAASPLLRRWAENALRRNEYRVLAANDAAAAKAGRLRIEGASDLTWTEDGHIRRFSSFGALIEALREGVHTWK